MTVYCLTCLWLAQRGGVYYCGNPVSNYYNGSVSPTSEKCCSYYKGRTV